MDTDRRTSRHNRLAQISPAIKNFIETNLRKNVIDALNDIYSNRAHQRCVDLSFATLLALISAITFWISYWFTDNRCHNYKHHEMNSGLCRLAVTFQVLIYVSVCVTPVLLILAIYSWINYACYNPLESIRQDFIGYKLDGEPWKHQLNEYYVKNRYRYLNCHRYRQRKELFDRGWGYIILSPYGVVIDELMMISSRNRIISEPTLLKAEKVLRLTLGKSCTRPWKRQLSVQMTEELCDQPVINEIKELLGVSNNTIERFP